VQTGRRPVTISFSLQWLRWVLLAVSIGLWSFVVRRWWLTRTPRTAVRRKPVPSERRSRPDPLVEGLDEETFWWERV